MNRSNLPVGSREESMANLETPSRSVASGVDERGNPARRIPPVFVALLALFIVGAVLLAGQFAAAMGGRNPAAVMDIAPSFETAVALPTTPNGGLESPRYRPRYRHSFTARKLKPAGGSRLAVCVRLCDGF